MDTTKWLHGLLEPCLLNLLIDGPDYGLALGRRLADAGLGELAGGTLYPALVRLQSNGLVRAKRVESPTGPPRKYFELTADGRRMAHDSAAAWAEFSAKIDTLIAYSHSQEQR